MLSLLLDGSVATPTCGSSTRFTMRLRYVRARRGETGPALNALRACTELARSVAQESQDREHAAVLVGRLGQVELGEDLTHVAFDGLAAEHELLGDALV